MRNGSSHRSIAPHLLSNASSTIRARTSRRSDKNREVGAGREEWEGRANENRKGDLYVTGVKVRGHASRGLENALGYSRTNYFLSRAAPPSGTQWPTRRRPFFCKWTRLIPRAERYSGGRLVSVRPTSVSVLPPSSSISCVHSSFRRIPPTTPTSASTMQICAREDFPLSFLGFCQSE